MAPNVSSFVYDLTTYSIWEIVGSVTAKLDHSKNGLLGGVFLAVKGGAFLAKKV